MTNTWFCSDTHMGHFNIINYCTRPFKSSEHMNTELIRKWNERVKPGDTVYFIGDFCFKSGSGKGNGDPVKAQEYIKQLNGNIVFLKGNHDCFSKKTRVLTINGYKSYNEINIGDLVPTVNLELNKIEYKPIKNITKTYPTHSFIFKTKTAEGSFSDIHKHWVIPFNRQNLKDPTKRILIPKKSNSVWNAKSPILLPTTFKSGNKDYDISDDYLNLAGWIFSDGHITKRGYIIIYQSKPNNINIIKNLLNKLNINYSVRIRNRNITHICDKKLNSVFAQYEFCILANSSKKIIKKLNINKKIKAPSFCYNLSDRQIKLFLDSIICGDGSKTTNGSFQVWGNKIQLDYLMGILVTHNIDCNLIKDSRNSYYLCVHCRNINNFGVRTVDKKHTSIIPNKDIMWDIEVDNHIIFIELNGKPLITGNSNNGLNTKIKSIVIEMGGIEIYCTHNPIDSNNFYKLNIVGHVHTLWKSRPDTKCGEKTILINVGVDVWNFYPVSFNEIMDEYEKYTKNKGL